MNQQELAHRAEQALLGGLLAGGDPGIVAQVRAGDFSDPRHQAIYLTLAGTTEPADGQADGRRGRLGRIAADSRKFLEELPLLGGERLRHFHVHAHKLVALSAAAQARHALPAEPERRAALGRGRNF